MSFGTIKNKTMKAKILIHVIILSFGMGAFFSCSDDNNEISETIAADSPSNNNSDAVLLKFENQSLKETLDLDFPANIHEAMDKERFIILSFYNTSNENSKAWLSIPNVQVSENFKIFHSRPDNSKLKLIAEEFTSNQPYSKTVTMKELHIVAIKASELVGLTRNDLDVRNYTEVIDYFNLK